MSSIELSARSFLRVYLESISWTILALAGFLGNILVLAALARNPILRRYTPIYVNALAISDILNFLTNGVFVGVTLVSGSLGGWAAPFAAFLFFSWHTSLSAPCLSRPSTDMFGSQGPSCSKKSSPQESPLRQWSSSGSSLHWRRYQLHSRMGSPLMLITLCVCSFVQTQGLHYGILWRLHHTLPPNSFFQLLQSFSNDKTHSTTAGAEKWRWWWHTGRTRFTKWRDNNGDANERSEHHENYVRHSAGLRNAMDSSTCTNHYDPRQSGKNTTGYLIASTIRLQHQ